MGLIDYHAQLDQSEKDENSPAGLFQMFALYEHQVRYWIATPLDELALRVSISRLSPQRLNLVF